MKTLRRALIVGAVAGVGLFLWRNRAWLHPSFLRGWIGRFGIWAPLVYVLLYALNTVTLLPPIGVLSLTAGLAFGPVVGFVAILAGAMIGSTATFFIARRLGRRFVERRLRGRFRSLDEALGKRGFATCLFLRLVPLVPYELLNYAPGLSQVRFRDYGLATFLGLIPGAAVAAFFGDSLTQPFSPRFLAGAAALLALIAVPAVWIRRRPSHGAD